MSFSLTFRMIQYRLSRKIFGLWARKLFRTMRVYNCAAIDIITGYYIHMKPFFVFAGHWFAPWSFGTGVGKVIAFGKQLHCGIDKIVLDRVDLRVAFWYGSVS